MCPAALCLAADNWPCGSAWFAVEEENTGNAVRCSAAAYMVFMQGYKVYARGCVLVCVSSQLRAVGYFFILVCEACEVMTGFYQGCRHCGNILTWAELNWHWLCCHHCLLTHRPFTKPVCSAKQWLLYCRCLTLKPWHHRHQQTKGFYNLLTLQTVLLVPVI